jgi:hypothetical protein
MQCYLVTGRVEENPGPKWTQQNLTELWHLTDSIESEDIKGLLG